MKIEKELFDEIKEILLDSYLDGKRIFSDELLNFMNENGLAEYLES